MYEELSNEIIGKTDQQIHDIKRSYFNIFCMSNVRVIANTTRDINTVINRLIDLLQDTFLDLFDHSIALSVAQEAANSYF